MKDTIKKSIKIVFSDRTVVTLLIVNAVVAIVVSIFLGSSIKHSEAQVITRYTTYGNANFYRSHWSSLLSYFALAFMIVLGHSAKCQVNFTRETKFGYISFVVNVGYFSYFSYFSLFYN